MNPQMLINYTTTKSHLVSYLFNFFLGGNAVKAGPPSRRGSGNNRLFIIGAGSTVDTLETWQWEIVGESESIGINYFALHPFRPSRYFIEKSHISEPPLRFAIGSSEKPTKVPILYFGGPDKENASLLRLARKLSVPFYIYPAISLNDGSPEFIQHQLQALFEKLGRKPPKSPIAIDGRSSVSRIATMGLLLGYREIVILGVDLSGPYFSQLSGFVDELSKREGTHNFEKDQLDRHPTDHEERDGLRISSFLETLDRIARQRGLGKILIGTAMLESSPNLEEFEWR